MAFPKQPVDKIHIAGRENSKEIKSGRRRVEKKRKRVYKVSKEHQTKAV